MPKPIELALSQIWNRKSVEALNATELGGYISLARAVILHGHDPLPIDRDTIQRLSRLSRIQWERSRNKITAALNETLWPLKASYRKALQVRETRLRVSRIAVAARASLGQLKGKLEAMPAQLAEADTLGVGLIQPHQAAPYIAKNYDTRARNAAIKQQETGAKPALTD